jgi:hypothetical protein
MKVTLQISLGRKQNDSRYLSFEILQQVICRYANIGDLAQPQDTPACWSLSFYRPDFVDGQKF